MNTQLIYQSDSSNKFWNIIVDRNKHTVTYGRVGTAGTSKTKEFDTVEAAIKDANKLIAAKKKKGYVEAAVKAQVVRDDYTFAGKPIKEFGSSFNPETAVKVYSESYNDDFPEISVKLDQLLKLANIKELDTLVIGEWEASEESADQILDKLIKAKDTLSGLKHLFVGDMDSESCEISWINQSDYSKFYMHFPALESFGVKGGQSLTLGNIKLPNLKNLVIETGGLDKQVIKDLCDSDLPNLEHLDIWLGTEDYGSNVNIEDLKPILDGKFPKLKFLGLKNYDQQDTLAKGLQDAPVLKNIETLDISMGILKDEGAEALYSNEALLGLKHINCRHHFISKEWQEKLKEKFAAQNINLEDAEEPYDEDYFYVEIGE